MHYDRNMKLITSLIMAALLGASSSILALDIQNLYAGADIHLFNLGVKHTNSRHIGSELSNTGTIFGGAIIDDNFALEIGIGPKFERNKTFSVGHPNGAPVCAPGVQVGRAYLSEINQRLIINRKSLSLIGFRELDTNPNSRLVGIFSANDIRVSHLEKTINGEPSTEKASKNKVIYSIGIGAEYKFTSNFFVRGIIEYLPLHVIKLKNSHFMSPCKLENTFNYKLGAFVIF